MTNTIVTKDIQLHRSDLRIIKDMIPNGASILDLGCGSGRLLSALKILKNAKVMGVEIDQKKVLECAARGVPVVQSDLNHDLKEFSDGSFDYVILSQTIQAIIRPDMVLAEMLRIGKHVIVSVINFGHINSRIQFACGSMPVTKNLPLPWYDTPNIHPSTIADFRRLCKDLNLKIHKEIPVSQENDFLPALASIWPNLFASNCIFVIGK